MTRSYNIYIVDAFADKMFEGNPAGVVIVDYKLSEDKMQKIAKELNLSETAFVERIDIDRYEVRFFTPVEEVDLCGHATIGTFYTMAKLEYIQPLEDGVKKVIQHTKGGKLPVYITYKWGKVINVTMEQSDPEEFGELKNLEKLAQALNISVEEIGLEGEDVKPEIISTGIKDVMVPVKNKDVIAKIVLNEELTLELNKEEDFYSIHAFALDRDQSTTYQRNFCPILGIKEEAATGTSTGAMLHYLQKHKLIDGNKIKAIQGIEMGRPSTILGEIVEVNSKSSIRVGGKAVKVIEGIMEI